MYDQNPCTLPQRWLKGSWRALHFHSFMTTPGTFTYWYRIRIQQMFAFSVQSIIRTYVNHWRYTVWGRVERRVSEDKYIHSFRDLHLFPGIFLRKYFDHKPGRGFTPGTHLSHDRTDSNVSNRAICRNCWSLIGQFSVEKQRNQWPWPRTGSLSASRSTAVRPQCQEIINIKIIFGIIIRLRLHNTFVFLVMNLFAQ